MTQPTEQDRQISAIIEFMRSLETDHLPEGWPAVRMQQVSALLDEIERLQARVAELEAICESVPEGCTPADARVLREANHTLIATVANLEKRIAIRGELFRITLRRKAEVKKERDIYRDEADLCRRKLEMAEAEAYANGRRIALEERDRLLGRVDELETERDGLLSQLPEGMKHCTIIFKECDKGHGWLTATNWGQHDCPTCERDWLAAKCAELEKQAQAIEDSEVCAGAALMLVHDRFMRGVLTKEIMIEAVNSAGTRSIAKLKSDAVREWLDDVIAMLVNSHEMTTHRGMTHVAIDHLREHLPQHEANQIEREGGV